MARRRNKKGSISDMPFIIGGIFAFALTALVVTVLLNNLNTQIQANDLFNTRAKNAARDYAGAFPTVVDGSMLFVFFAACLVSIALAALVPVHPVFFIFYLLEFLLLIYLGAGIANAYEEIITNPIFATEEGQYPITIFFFRYFPFIIGVVGAVLAIVVYKTRQSFI